MLAAKTIARLEATRWRGQIQFPDRFNPTVILIFRLGDNFIGIRAYCPHAGQDLSDCPLDSEARLICPRHGLPISVTGRDGFRVTRSGENFMVPWPLESIR